MVDGRTLLGSILTQSRQANLSSYRGKKKLSFAAAEQAPKDEIFICLLLLTVRGRLVGASNPSCPVPDLSRVSPADPSLRAYWFQFAVMQLSRPSRHLRASLRRPSSCLVQRLRQG